MKYATIIIFLFTFKISNSQINRELLEKVCHENSIELLDSLLNCKKINSKINKSTKNIVEDNALNIIESIFSYLYSNISDINKSKFILSNRNLTKIYLKEKLLFDSTELDSIIYNNIEKSDYNEKTKKLFQTKKNGRYILFVEENFLPKIFLEGKQQNSFLHSNIEYYPSMSIDTSIKFIELTEDEKIDINDFINNEPDNIRRVEFISKLIKTYENISNTKWVCESTPEITFIVMDNNCQNAIVNFKNIILGKEAILFKENNKWIVKGIKIIWEY